CGGYRSALIRAARLRSGRLRRTSFPVCSVASTARAVADVRRSFSPRKAALDARATGLRPFGHRHRRARSNLWASEGRSWANAVASRRRSFELQFETFGFG